MTLINCFVGVVENEAIHGIEFLSLRWLALRTCAIDLAAKGERLSVANLADITRCMLMGGSAKI